MIENWNDLKRVILYGYGKVGFCQNCGGLGKDNKMFVTAGEQY